MSNNQKTNKWVIIDLQDCKPSDEQEFGLENMPGIEDVRL